MIQKDISYEMRLRECCLTTLETRRLRGDHIKVSKTLNRYDNIDREHDITLSKKQRRFDMRNFHFHKEQ